MSSWHTTIWIPSSDPSPIKNCPRVVSGWNLSAVAAVLPSWIVALLGNVGVVIVVEINVPEITTGVPPKAV
jgi:hypothetical protein